jgi:hypothetical protein
MLTVHTDDLAAGETRRVGDMRVTTTARTAFDIGRRVDLVEGVQRVDALMNATDLKVSDIESVVALHSGVRGLTQLRRTLDLVDSGAESPWESLTGLMFLRAGFPRPETQIHVYDGYGMLVAVIDMGWREYLVGSTSRVRIIGPICGSGIGTSSASPACPSSAGRTFG